MAATVPTSQILKKVVPICFCIGAGMEYFMIKVNYSIKYFPDRPEAYCNLGVILEDIGKTKDAEVKIKKAIDPKGIMNPNKILNEKI